MGKALFTRVRYLSYRSTSVRSKKWYGEGLCSHGYGKESSGAFQNRSRNWAVRRSEPEIGMIRYRTVPFSCEKKRYDIVQSSGPVWLIIRVKRMRISLKRKSKWRNTNARNNNNNHNNKRKRKVVLSLMSYLSTLAALYQLNFALIALSNSVYQRRRRLMVQLTEMDQRHASLRRNKVIRRQKEFLGKARSL